MAKITDVVPGAKSDAYLATFARRNKEHVMCRRLRSGL